MDTILSGKELKNKALSGVVWACLGQTGQGVLAFIISLVLARLLDPETFGLVAMLAIFMSLANALMDSGWTATLIQKAELESSEISSVFVANLITGFVLMGLFWFTAPAIAAFYHQPVLCPLTRFVSIQFPINAFSLVQWGLLKRKLNFRAESLVRIGGIFAGGVVGMWGALRGWGVWSLAAQGVVQSCVRTGLFFWFNRWTPVWRFEWAALRALLPYGLNIFGVTLLENVVSRVDYLLIGRFISVRDLGLYNRAWTLKDLPAENISGVINQVMFPAFSRIQHNARLTKQAFRRSLCMAFVIVTPLMIGMVVTARDLIHVVYSERWIECVPYLRWFCFGAILAPPISMGCSLILAAGRADVYFRLSLIRGVCLVLVFAVGIAWGVQGIIAGWLAVQGLMYILFSKQICRFAQYGWNDQVRDILPVLGIAVGSAFVAVPAISFLDVSSPAWRLLLIWVLFGSCYASACWLFRIASVRDLVNVFSEAIHVFRPTSRT